VRPLCPCAECEFGGYRHASIEFSVLFRTRQIVPDAWSADRGERRDLSMCDHHAGISRRNVFRAGAAAATIGVTGLALPSLAFASRAPVTGECGPLPDDPHFAGRTGAARTLAVEAASSYNGWPVGTPASTIGVANHTVENTSIVLPVKSGDVATVLMYVAGRFNREVQALRSGQCWGYGYRKNVNNPSVWSNHASGTAVDLNAVLHPNGAKNTFTSSQVSSIRAILAHCGEVIYWGGDYRGTTDEMHFEIDVEPGSAALTELVRKIRSGGVSGGRQVGIRARANGRVVCAEAAGGASLIASRSAVGPWETFTMIDRGGGTVAMRAAANNRYVCAESAGGSALIANRAAVGQWETFRLVTNSDGSFSLRAQANGRYVCADAAGGAPLIANREAIGAWEKFDLIR
jgi:hypothetical protein